LCSVRKRTVESITTHDVRKATVDYGNAREHH